MTEPEARHDLRDTLVVWLAVEVLVAIFVQIKWTIPAIGQVGGALVALLFLYVPIVMAKRRGEFIEDYGFVFGSSRGLYIAAVAIALIVPLFAAGYIGFYQVACTSDALSWLPIKSVCAAYRGFHAIHAPTVDGDLLQFFPVQLIVVAVPEELFFRGYMLTLLERRFPPKRRWLGGGIGLALVLSSLAFAFVHLPRDHGDPRALFTFFPGLLFGWMRSSTKSLTASTITHASSNLLVHLLELATQ